MTKEQLYKILKDNGVKYDKDVEKESTEGFVNDDCAKCAEELYETLFRLTAFGMQEGFSKCEDEIKDLTKLIASMITGTSRKTVNLAKTREKHQQIIKDATYLRREINMSMIDEVMKNLNACIAAADAIAEIRKDNVSLCNNLAKSKDILTQLKEKLSNVADVSSTAAADLQAEIFNGLLDWREQVSHCHCYSDTVENLGKTLDTADKWLKLTKAVSRFSKAKAGSDYYVYDQGEKKWDDIEQIVAASRFAERTEGLRSDLASYRNQTKNQYDVDALRAELTRLQSEFFAHRDTINARLSEIQQESDSILISYQNGEIDAVTSVSSMKILNGEKADLEDELAEIQQYYNDDSRELNNKISFANGDKRVRNRLADRFENFIKQVEGYRESDPALFVLLCEQLDFNDMYDTLSGKLSESEATDVYTKMEVVIEQIGNELQKQRKNLRVLNRINARQHQKNEERVLQDREEEAKIRSSQTLGTRERRSTGNNASAEDEAKRMMDEMLANRFGASKKVGNPNDGDGNPTGITGIHNEDK